MALYTAASYGGTSLDDTTFTLAIVPVEGVSLEAAEAALDAAIEGFLEEGPDPVALERLRRQYAAAAIYAQDDVQGLARQYGTALTAGLTVADVQEWPEVLQAVTAEDVMAAAREVFDRDRAVTGWLRAPVGEAPQEVVVPAASGSEAIR